MRLSPPDVEAGNQAVAAVLSSLPLVLPLG